MIWAFDVGWGFEVIVFGNRSWEKVSVWDGVAGGEIILDLFLA